jgi:hypothetical protein
MIRYFLKRFLLTLLALSGMLAGYRHDRRPTALSEVCCQNDW